MTPDLERAACAICRAEPGYSDNACYCEKNPEFDWDGCKQRLASARAALQSVRELSEEVKRARNSAFLDGGADFEACMDAAWQAAIDRICE